MQTMVMEISPSLADEWLKKNTGNRAVSRNAVDRYAADMSAGEWRLNHQGIAFSENGRLVDGQHRLHAIIKSGATVKMLVTWGSDQIGIDELRVRHAADVVKFGGLSDWLDQKRIMIAKAMYMLSDNRSRSSISTIELVNFANKHKNAINFAHSLFPSNRKGISSVAAKAVIATAFYSVHSDILSEFVGTLYSGVVSSPKKSSAIRCREQLLDGKFSGGFTERKRMAWRMMRAIKAFADDQPLKALHNQNSAEYVLPE